MDALFQLTDSFIYSYLGTYYCTLYARTPNKKYKKNPK